jgi:hypothetical protein
MTESARDSLKLMCFLLEPHKILEPLYFAEITVTDLTYVDILQCLEE